MNPKIIILACLLAGVAGCSQDRVLLLPGDDGLASSGAVAVLSARWDTRAVINRAYADASIGSGSVDQNITNAATVEKNYGTLIRALPLRRFTICFREGTAIIAQKFRPEPRVPQNRTSILCPMPPKPHRRCRKI
jgi:hypothetical protein